ncbi:hypothetical protein CBS101457_001267 [Exobasidium rhododendri]|nr:hypothetical protein CBS101457_001267 [Exobasidium rhododendri]
MEEIRKAEHRTVLLNSAPTPAQVRSNTSTSSLKLRKKGLAPSAINSPLIQSRAGTPNDNFSGLAESPNLGGNQKMARVPSTSQPSTSNLHKTSTKTDANAGVKEAASTSPTLWKRLIQLLAKGPISRRNIVTQLHHPESAILTLLHQVSNVAAEGLQPRLDAAKKFSGPVNRRSSSQLPASSSSGDRGASTMYVLKDELYRQVSIKDWGEYDSKERQSVSEEMEAALKRLGVRKDAEEWKRLFPDGPSPVEGAESSNEENGVSRPMESTSSDMRRREAANSSSSLESLSKLDMNDEPASAKATIKKNSTMDRLKKAAKGRTSGRTGTPVPSGQATAARKTKEKDSDKDAKKAAPKVSEEPTKTNKEGTIPRVTHAKETLSPVMNIKESTTNKATSAKSNGTKKKVVMAPKLAARKDIEYTDSSDESDNRMDVDDQRPSRSMVPASHLAPRSASSISSHKSVSTSPEGKRARHGVGGGAAFTSEPWLDVKSRRDWNKLAERFNRVFEEYSRDLTRLQQEEEMIRIDLEGARVEEEVRRVPTPVEASMRLEVELDEREEGEASPTLERDSTWGASTIKTIDPSPFTNVAWRSKTREGRDLGTVVPMTLDEIKVHLSKLRETEAQLNRMKGTLQASKGTLELVTA